MRLTRLRVAELRQFKAPFELADIEPGLNIFTGANEAGKSTLVRAIRAAFFERHRSTSVDDLRPYGDSAAAPLVELDFEIGGVSCRLTKSFLHRKRCELRLGSRRLEGAEAEDHLASLLGFAFADARESKPKHQGIPGLLWIEQGQAHALREVVDHAATHLRKALDESLGQLAATGGDELVDQVHRLRDELLTAPGKPRADYAKALEQAGAWSARVLELEQAVAQYQGQVDQLRPLCEEHRADTQAEPWVALSAQQANAQQALQAAEALAEQLRRAQEQGKQAAGLRELLAQRLAAAEQQRHDLGVREATLAAAITHHEQAAVIEAQAVGAEAAAAVVLRAAREALALARQEDARALLTRQANDAQIRASDLAAALTAASSENERAASQRREAASLRVDPADLATLGEQHRRLHELRIRHEAVATRLQFDLQAGVTVELAGQALVGQAERLLVEPALLTVPGVGRIQVTPGGTDLAVLAQTQAELQDRQAALLQRLGLASLAEAEIRHQAHSQRLAAADAAEQARKLLAPKGLEVLSAELDAAQARVSEAAAALAQLPAAPAAGALALQAAEHAHDGARQAAEQAAQQMQSARQSLLTAASERDAAQRETDTLKAALQAPRLQAELTAQQRELVQAGAREATIQHDIAAIEARIAAARPDILRQDVQRLQRSVAEAQREHQARSIRIAQIEAALAVTGAQGLEEELAKAHSASHQAERRTAELRRRAEALDFLLRKLELRRQALVRRLQAPLQKHLDHYLRLLFPSGRLEVDASLVPGALTRSAAHGPEAADFDTLSFGAREQMGVISRLAYADLLQAAGRPTLIILDDALVHSDAQRLAQMKRVLFDTAQRHQVLLFTCHPGNWRDMGVALRSLDAQRSA